jgi:hypothetical protein
MAKTLGKKLGNMARRQSQPEEISDRANMKELG